MVDPTTAAGAYQNLSGLSGKGMAAPASSSAKAEGMSFGDFLEGSVRNTIGALEQSEKVSADAVVGKADITDVMEAVNNAELMLDTVISVRDRMITAYQEIMRMPI